MLTSSVIRHVPVQGHFSVTWELRQSPSIAQAAIAVRMLTSLFLGRLPMQGHFSMTWELGTIGTEKGTVTTRALLKGWSLPIVGRSFEIKLCAPDAGKHDAPLLVLTGAKGSRNCEVKSADGCLYAKVSTTVVTT